MNLIKVGTSIINLDNVTDFDITETADGPIVTAFLIGEQGDRSTLQFADGDGVALRAWLESQSTDVINWHRRINPERAESWGSAG